jgi:predicted Zn finger-like uncharacterized protein
MRLVCPNCDAVYEVADTAVPASGREVQCSACAHRWFHRPASSDAAPVSQGSAAERSTATVPETARADESQTPAGRADAPQARPTDPAVLQILREEAAREMEQRRRGPGRSAPGEPATRREPATAEPAKAEPAKEPAAHEPATPRRALLPEIDEVSPTLHPHGAQGEATVIHRPSQPRSRGGFAAGFAVSLTISAMAAAAYFWAPDLADAVPPLAEPLEAYVAAVDDLRLTIHDAAR